MIAGICGGLDPDLPVGTLICPETLVEHSTGLTYRHRPPGDMPLRGKLVTTETVSFDVELSLRLFADGCLAVDMESSAVAEVCERRAVPWSVYRCISDRHFDGLLDARVVALTNPDGSGDMAAIGKLLAEEPEVAEKLTQLGRDSAQAAQFAAEAALRGCRALDP
jgi:nucleoside phosphorylase